MVKLFEYQGKDVFDTHGIQTPKRIRCKTAADVRRAIKRIKGKQVVIKAQIKRGKRGKAGAVRVVDKKDAAHEAKRILKLRIDGERPESVLVEQKVDILEEFYLAVIVNAKDKSLSILFSKQGGIDIEDLAHGHPRAIIQANIHPPYKTLPKKITSAIKSCKNTAELARIMKQLIDVCVKEDATLVEINPLARTKDGYVALDSKIVIDDNALFRHTTLKNLKEDLTPTERRAKKKGLHYVDLAGDIAVIGNGAGLVMATLDMLDQFGGKPSNFLDVQGGTGAKMMEDSLDICLSKKGVKGIFVNIFAGITDCNEIAEGILSYKKKHKIMVPFVVRMTGTHEKNAHAMLKNAGVLYAATMDAGARLITKKVRR